LDVTVRTLCAPWNIVAELSSCYGDRHITCGRHATGHSWSLYGLGSHLHDDLFTMLCQDDADTKTTFTIVTRNESPTKEKKLGSSAEMHGWGEVMFLTTPAEGQPRVALLVDTWHIDQHGIEARKVQ
jgi:hypothetical protein